MILCITEKILLLIGIVDFIGIFTLIGVMLYVAKTKTETILSHLTNSSISSKITMLWHGGPWGRIYMMGEVFAIMRSPAIYIHTGKLCAKDFENFPRKLRKKLITLYRLVFIFYAIMICLGLVAYIEDMQDIAINPIVIMTIVSFTGLLLVNGILLYVAKRRLEIILTSLKHSSITSSLFMLWQAGLGGRIYMLGEISGILKNPSRYISQGKVSARDVKNFPPKLKRDLLKLNKCQQIFGFTFVGFALLAMSGLI
ncbi:UNVERIFIED_ORG: hypothetical protein J2X80_001847 [Pseudomonas fluorescens]|jgi:hypothetical protein|uniref:hypothetical protein n=1 Tax=Pseudomonas TaxID=286 RepID=UPI000A1D9FDF|nr:MULTISPECIES: hypothetical protein [unclassified Pseudomonas]MDP9709770.1 hypothetical protein [Pseudomonas fluorescens]QZD70792.1 hypothetical protein K3819_26825 [Pseudomonas sp. 3-2]